MKLINTRYSFNNGVGTCEYFTYRIYAYADSFTSWRVWKWTVILFVVREGGSIVRHVRDST